MTEFAIRQPAAMIGRSLRMSRRNVDALITSLMLPVMLMLLFVYLFGGAIQTGTRYVTYVVPGVLLLCAGFGASMTAVSVSHDMAEGIIDRFRSMDVGGTAVIAGHVVASVARNLVSTALVLGIAFAIGFRPHAGAGEWLARSASSCSSSRDLVVLRGDRPRRPLARGGRRIHLLRQLPAVPEQRLRPGRHDARLDPGLRAAPTGDGRRGDPARSPARSADRQSPQSAILWCAGILLASMLLSAGLFRLRTK